MLSSYVCDQCGIEFQKARTSGPAPKYCSLKCKRVFDIKQAKARRLARQPIKICAYCGCEETQVLLE